MATRNLTVGIGLALASTIVFALLRSNSTEPKRELPDSPAIEVKSSTEPSQALAAPAESERDVVATPVADAPSTHLVEIVTESAPILAFESGRNMRVVLGVGSPRPPAFGAPHSRSPAFIHEGTTDDDGRLTIRVPWDEIEAAREQPDAQLWAYVVGPGLQRRKSLRDLPVRPTKRTVLPVFTHSDGMVRGRVVDESGNPVVALVTYCVFDSEGKLGSGPTTTSERDSRFEIADYRRETANFLADAGEFGTGAVRDVDLDALAPILIVVSGSGVLRGRVFDERGLPVPEFPLTAWPAAFDTARGSRRFPEPARSFAELEGRGRIRADARTDARGAFEIRGLREDHYVIRCGNTPYPWGPFEILLTPAPVPTDGAPLELQFRRTYLAVRVVNDRGQPFEGQVDSGATTTQWGPGRVEPMDRWPADVRVVVLPGGAEDDLTKLTNPRLAGTASDDGEFIFPVTADRSYRVGLMGGTQPWKPVNVFVPSDAGRVEVMLRATEIDAMGTLALVTRLPESNAFGEGFSISIEDVEDGATLLFQDMRSTRASSGEYRLPEGRYRVVVQGESYIGWHGTMYSSTDLGRFESVVSITRDTTTQVEATMPIGARIELELVGDILDEDNAAVRAELRDGWVILGSIENYSIRATTTLRAKDRRPIPVQFPYLVTGSSAAGTHLGPWIAIGTSGTSETLPAGEFRFEARMPGGRVVARDVTLVEGQTTRLVLAMPSHPAHAADGK